MTEFRNLVRCFSLALRHPKGWHCKGGWRKIDKTRWELPVVRDQIFPDFLGHQLRNLNRILTFVCYTFHNYVKQPGG